MPRLTIDLDTSGLATAQQIRDRISAERDQMMVKLQQTVARHTLEVREINVGLHLCDVRLAEIDAFLAFQAKQP